MKEKNSKNKSVNSVLDPTKINPLLKSIYVWSTASRRKGKSRGKLKRTLFLRKSEWLFWFNDQKSIFRLSDC